nr:MBL fold metallo-hydrolase [Maliibacterium massiliense]
MQLRILGNEGPYASPGGATSGYLVSSGSTHVLLDCGSGVLAALMQALPLGELTAVVLSHLHGDHCCEVPLLRYALQLKRYPGALRRKLLPVYLPARPEEEYASISTCHNKEVFAFSCLENNMQVRIGALCFTFAPMAHPIASYGMRISDGHGTLVYTGDTNQFAALADFARGADVLLADAGLSQEYWTPHAPHLSARGCGELAADAGVKRLVLTHLAPYLEPQALLAEARTAFAHAELANRGSAIDIG